MDNQDEVEQIGAKSLSYGQSLTHSAYVLHKALQRRPTRTSKTHNYVRCWLLHCIYGNEKKMQHKHELITLNEKA